MRFLNCGSRVKKGPNFPNRERGSDQIHFDFKELHDLPRGNTFLHRTQHVVFKVEVKLLYKNLFTKNNTFHSQTLDSKNLVFSFLTNSDRHLPSPLAAMKYQVKSDNFFKESSESFNK